MFSNCTIVGYSKFMMRNALGFFDLIDTDLEEVPLGSTCVL